MLSRFAAFSLIALIATTAAADTAKPKKAAPQLQVAKPAPAPAPRPAKPVRAQVKSRAIEVWWGDQWWAAEIMETRGDQTKIHYTGWGPEWDEWVGADRMRTVAPRVPPKNVKVGSKLEVEWHGRWWAGEVITTKNGFYKIHYSGWGPEWDEWMEIDRMRAPTGRVEPRGPATPPVAFTDQTL